MSGTWTTSGSKTRNTADAKKRLLRDLKELRECDELLQTVNAQPEEENFFVWHCNLRPKEGPFRGSVFHIIMEFPDNYPVSPPGVLLMTSFDHPNVYGSNMAGFRFKHVVDLAQGYSYGGGRGRHICLDILKNYSTNTPYYGWSRAYSVASILLQLQSFLFAENVPQGGSYTMKNSGLHGGGRAVKSNNLKFCCPRPGCCHTGKNPSPALSFCPEAKVQPQRRFLVLGPRSGETKVNFLRNKPSVKKRSQQPRPREKDHTALARSVFQNDLLVNKIMEFLTTQDVLMCKRASRSLCRMIERYNIFGRREVKCFFTKETYETTTLGVGLNVERFGDRVDTVTGRNGHGRPKSITSQMDYLSHEAYGQDIRSGVWGDSFNEWIPLIISKSHGERVFKPLCDSIFTLTTPPKVNVESNVNYKRCSIQSLEFADRALDVLSCLMNSMAVSMVDTSDPTPRVVDPYSYGSASTRNAVSVSLCEKAVLGYCSFHHVLLFLAEKCPRIRELANERVRRFKANMAGRHKANTRDLGKFLVSLCLSDLGWEAIRDEFCLEAGARSVLWATRKDECLKSIPNAQHDLDYKVPPAPLNGRDRWPELALTEGTKVMAAWNDENRGRIGEYDLHRVSLMPYYPAVVTRGPHYSRSCFGVMVRFDDPGYMDTEYFRRLDGKCVKPATKSTQPTVPLTQKLFEASVVGKRLTMFQIYFLLHIGRPAGKSPRDILRMYNERLGRPTLDMTRKITSAAKAIMKVKNWHDYYSMIGMDRDTCASIGEQLLKVAKTSFKNASYFGYKGDFHFRRRQQEKCLTESRPTTQVPKVPSDAWWIQPYHDSQEQACGRAPVRSSKDLAAASAQGSRETHRATTQRKAAKKSKLPNSSAPPVRPPSARGTPVSQKAVAKHTPLVSTSERKFRILAPNGVGYRPTRDLKDRSMPDAVARKGDVVRSTKVVKESNVIWAWVDVAELWLPVRILRSTQEPVLAEEICTTLLVAFTKPYSSITAAEVQPKVASATEVAATRGAKPQMVAAAPTGAAKHTSSVAPAKVDARKSVRSALCIIPPKEIWAPIQEIRKKHDKSYVRWMPHFNICYPYYEEGGGLFESQIPLLTAALSNVAPMEISMSEFHYFPKRNGNLYGWLKMDNEEGAVALGERIFKLYPELKGRNKFQPHLTVGQWPKKFIVKALEKYQRQWKSLSFTLDRVYIISRRGDEPFKIRHEIPLGGTASPAAATEVATVPTETKPQAPRTSVTTIAATATEAPTEGRSESAEAAVCVEYSAALRTYRIEQPSGVAYRSAREVAARCPGLFAKHGEVVSGSEVVQEGNVTWLRVEEAPTLVRWLPVQAGAKVLAREVFEEPAQAMPPTPEHESVGLTGARSESESAPAPTEEPPKASPLPIYSSFPLPIYSSFPLPHLEAPTALPAPIHSLPSLLPPLPVYNGSSGALCPAEDVPDTCLSRSASPWAAPVEMAAEKVFADSPVAAQVESVPIDHEKPSPQRGWSAPREQDWDAAESQFDTFHVICRPSIAHRRSRDIADRLETVARYGTKVTGMVEGNWLRLSCDEERWLPLSMRGHRLLAVL